MFRKTYQLTFVLILNALSCLAQSGLVFDRPAWDFGTIRETDGPVTHRFVCRNEGEHPEVILQVTTTCGCTIPRYTRKPILPGEEAEITVTYDPANRPGNFSRELAVFTADRRIAAVLLQRYVERNGEQAFCGLHDKRGRAQTDCGCQNRSVNAEIRAF